jgi:isoaspartyl peptidase/L-asparaginase-like protein (Ntn-hydrolase superfamily)
MIENGPPVLLIHGGAGNIPDELVGVDTRLGAQGGLIPLDRSGRTGLPFNAYRMAWGVRTAAETSASVDRSG